MDRESGIRRIAREKIKKFEGILIYLCDECGIIEYKDHIVPGGKKCEGCGFIMFNEEQD